MDWATVLLVWDVLQGVLPIAATVFAGWAAWEARAAARESGQKGQLEVFLQFAEQYDRLRVGFSLPKASGTLSEEEMDAAALRMKRNEPQIMALFRLFEREHYLYISGMVPARIWAIWRNGMQKFVARKAIREMVLAQRGMFRERFIAEIVDV